MGSGADEPLQGSVERPGLGFPTRVRPAQGVMVMHSVPELPEHLTGCLLVTVPTESQATLVCPWKCQHRQPGLWSLTRHPQGPAAPTPGRGPPMPPWLTSKVPVETGSAKGHTLLKRSDRTVYLWAQIRFARGSQETGLGLEKHPQKKVLVSSTKPNQEENVRFLVKMQSTPILANVTLKQGCF